MVTVIVLGQLPVCICHSPWPGVLDPADEALLEEDIVPQPESKRYYNYCKLLYRLYQ